MATQQIAQGLAGLGRHGDSTLVHMQPEEVAGLQALAKTQGTSLTINPETGLPEAFNLGGFFRSLAPTLAGLGVAMIPGMQPYALQAGIAAGAATGAALNKKDRAMGALTGAISGFGGQSLAGAAMNPAAAASVKAGGYDPSLVLKNSATAPSGWAATEQTFPTALGSAQNAGNFGFQAGYTPVQGLDAAPLAPNFSTAGRTGMVGAGDVNTADILANNSLNATSGMGGMQGATPAATTFSDNLNKAYTNVAANPMGFVKDNAFKIGAPLAMATLEGMQPELMPMGQNPNDRYDPDRSLNLNTNTGLKFEPYLNNYAQGGPVSFAEGGAMQGGGSRAMQGGNLNLNTVSGLQEARAMAGVPPQIGTRKGTNSIYELAGGTPAKSIYEMAGGTPARSINEWANLSLYAQGGPVSFADGGEALRGGGEKAMQGSGLLPLDVADIDAKYGYNRDSSAAQPWGGSGLWGSYNTWGARSSMPNIAPPQLGLFADNDQIEAARTAYEAQLAAAMSGRGGMGAPYGMGQPAMIRGMGGMQNPSGGTNNVGLPAMVSAMGAPTAKTAPTASTAETALSRLNLNKTYANGGTVSHFFGGGQARDRSNDNVVRVDSNSGRMYNNDFSTLYKNNPEAVWEMVRKALPWNEGVPMRNYLDGGSGSSLGGSEALKGGNLNLNTASGLGYANGGTIQGGGLQDLYGSRDDNMAGPALSRNGYGLGRLQAMADGGMASYAKGGETSKSIEVMNRVMTTPIPGTNVTINDGLVRSFPHLAGRFEANEPLFMGGGSGAMQGGNLNLNTASGLGEARLADTGAQIQYQPHVNAFLNSPSAMSGYGYAKGGYLDGPGDGMSDSIPATIEGKQPARLADGEFVIPADVVSHLGNGSTKAGSKRLYAMLDKVRHARTGTKKQGKQIKPEKYMPA
jgi:hypothetical protein